MIIELSEKDKDLLRNLEGIRHVKSNVKLGGQYSMDMEKAPGIVKKLIEILKKEEGLTYVGAYAALEITYEILMYESNFVSLLKK